MNFKAMNHEFFKTCLANDYCTDCAMRVGCRLRYEFYDEDLSYEMCIQIAEIYIISKRNISNNSTLELINRLREKREREIMLNPHFSYD